MERGEIPEAKRVGSLVFTLDGILEGFGVSVFLFYCDGRKGSPSLLSAGECPLTNSRGGEGGDRSLIGRNTKTCIQSSFDTKGELLCLFVQDNLPREVALGAQGGSSALMRWGSDSR